MNAGKPVVPKHYQRRVGPRQGQRYLAHRRRAGLRQRCRPLLTSKLVRGVVQRCTRSGSRALSSIVVRSVVVRSGTAPAFVEAFHSGRFKTLTASRSAPYQGRFRRQRLFPLNCQCDWSPVEIPCRRARPLGQRSLRRAPRSAPSDRAYVLEGSHSRGSRPNVVSRRYNG